MPILAIGLNHKTAPVSLRETLSFSSSTLCGFLNDLGQTHTTCAAPHILHETIVLSTCNRLEIYTYAASPKPAYDEIINRLSRFFNLAPINFEDHLYFLQGEEAVDHLMRVTCGLDSLVLGEAQILGQVAQAYQSAKVHQSAGKILSRLFEMAAHAGKRARTETAIGFSQASVSSVALRLAEKRLGSLTDKTVMVLGAGEMGMLTLKTAGLQGVRHFIVVNRTKANAERLAAQWNALPLTFDEIEDGLAQADLVITSTGAPHTVLHKTQVAQAMARRPEKPLFIVDIALPRDVDDDVTDIAHVHLNNLDHLQSQVEDNLKVRKREIPAVETIIAQEKQSFLNWSHAQNIIPTLNAFRTQLDSIRRKELERALNRMPNIDDQQQRIMAEMTRRLMNKFLHQPTVRLREEAARGNGVEYVNLLHNLFALEEN